MIKWILGLVVLAVLGIGGFFLYQSFRTTSPKPGPKSSAITATTPTPVGSPSTTQTSQDACQVLQQGSVDVPPLYKEGITWQDPTITDYEVPLGGGNSQKVKGCFITSKKIAEGVAENIRSYYFDELKKFGWDNLVSADSPFSGRESYQKGKKLIYVRKYVSPEEQSQTPSMLIDIFYSQ